MIAQVTAEVECWREQVSGETVIATVFHWRILEVTAQVTAEVEHYWNGVSGEIVVTNVIRWRCVTT